MPSPGESEQDAGFGYKSPAETENQSHGDSKVKESLPFHMDAESESERLTCRPLRCCYELCKSIVVCQNVPDTFKIQGQSTVGASRRFSTVPQSSQGEYSTCHQISADMKRHSVKLCSSQKGSKGSLERKGKRLQHSACMCRRSCSQRQALV